MNGFPTIRKLIINKGEIQYCLAPAYQPNVISWPSSLINRVCICEFDRAIPFKFRESDV